MKQTTQPWKAENRLAMSQSSYDPDRHRRRSIRLKGYDYTQAGAYFVTLCTHDRVGLFGAVVDGHVALNAYGRVAAAMWGRMPRHFPGVELDEWVVMPNHLHGIVVIVEATGRGRAADERGAVASGAPAPGSLGALVGNFKSVTARRINRMRKSAGAPVWQRNYHERIIHNQRELNANLRQPGPVGI